MLSSISFGASPSRSSSSPAPSSPTSIVLAGLDDELRDAHRVLSHGQEEDLRYALNRVLNKVEELSSFLKTALKNQTELETQLNLAKSNLQLIISNNEMLEEALKRETPYSARDVGWRRWSAREVQDHNTEKTSEERPRSLDYGPLNESGAPTVPSTADRGTSKLSLIRGQVLDHLLSPLILRISPHPSLSSLVPNAREKEMEELQEQLERERQAHKAADVAKAALEAELESLSQALFEEVDPSSLTDSVRLKSPQANKMVSTERMRRAETEEELYQTRLEKDALHQALKLIEGENGRLRNASAPPDTPMGRIDQSDTPPVVLPVRLSPEQHSSRPPSRPSTDKVTTPIAPLYEIPGHLAGFQLEPAPKPSLAGLHRKTTSWEESLIADLSVSSLKESLPVTGAQ
ncbi:hypothetical protein J3R82DRAFT_10845 [Butyriboletus roseoflavus]|nr:hypothetical protein J3R82DRAFT_10845 [Butyriboletus roseoflavus]